MLPQHADLDQLRRQAKELRDAARAGDPDALVRVRAHAAAADASRLATAQLTVAREHGYPSWPRLVAGIEEATEGLAARVDAFLAASVTGRTGRAARLLAAEPAIADHDHRTSVVLGDAARVRDHLARDPGLAVRPDARSGWPLLLGVCSSRWHVIDPTRATGMLEVARLLLDAGADPNTTVGDPPGHPSHCSTLFAAAGCADNPAITELLLARGAAPDDHTLYLAAFHPDHRCLRLLLRHGAVSSGSTALAAPISTGDTEAVRLLLDAGADPRHPLPADLLAEAAPPGRDVTAVNAAIEAECPAELIELLLRHGADPDTPDRSGRSPYRQALRRDRSDVADLLARHGARADGTALDLLLGACLRGDQARTRRLLRDDPGLLDRLGPDDHEVLVQAAGRGRLDAVRLMLDLGFPTDARGGDDGATALHVAAGSGHADVVRLLVDRGADIEEPDPVWGSTPLVWASVGSGLQLAATADSDWVAAVRILVGAGARVDDAWVEDKPPSQDVAELLRARGVPAPDQEHDT